VSTDGQDGSRTRWRLGSPTRRRVALTMHEEAGNPRFSDECNRELWTHRGGRVFVRLSALILVRPLPMKAMDEPMEDRSENKGGGGEEDDPGKQGVERGE